MESCHLHHWGQNSWQYGDRVEHLIHTSSPFPLSVPPRWNQNTAWPKYWLGNNNENFTQKGDWGWSGQWQHRILQVSLTCTNTHKIPPPPPPPPPSNIWLGKCQSAWKGIKSLEMEQSKTCKNSKELYTRLWEWKHNGLLLTDLLLNWCQVVSREILEKNLKPRKLKGVRAPLLYYHTCKEWFCIKNGLWCQHFCLLFH